MISLYQRWPMVITVEGGLVIQFRFLSQITGVSWTSTSSCTGVQWIGSGEALHNSLIFRVFDCI